MRIEKITMKSYISSSNTKKRERMKEKKLTLQKTKIICPPQRKLK